MSVRFLGRCVYVALAMVLVSARHAGPTPARGKLVAWLEVPVRTVQRWRTWWRDRFPRTRFWQGARGRFMPPVEMACSAASVLDRFAGEQGADRMQGLLMFLRPLSVGVIAMAEGG